MQLKNKDLLGLKDITSEEINLILSTASEMKKILNQGVKKVPHLQNKSMFNLFYENSTRTSSSFDIAGKYLSACVSNLSVKSSSIQKGETLIDTGKTLDALQADVIVIRHGAAGAPKLLADNVRASVINAGDGMNEHPTQARLDMFTMREKFGRLEGLKIAIVGDIKHSRVARSNIWGLNKMGASVSVTGPYTLIPFEIEKMGAKVIYDTDEAVRGVDVVMPLRMQLERQQEGGLVPSVREYHKYYGINRKRLELASKGAILMHPGPINRGVELTSEIADSLESVIEEQILNGVAVRMALLFLLTRGGKK